jgi:hypothetical protein
MLQLFKYLLPLIRDNTIIKRLGALFLQRFSGFGEVIGILAERFIFV